MVDSHVALVIKMNAELSESSFTQYIKKIEDAMRAVQVLTQVIPMSMDRPVG